eukprot:1192189-Prorocentrum_minimum.AAC.1
MERTSLFAARVSNQVSSAKPHYHHSGGVAATSDFSFSPGGSALKPSPSSRMSEASHSPSPFSTATNGTESKLSGRSASSVSINGTDSKLSGSIFNGSPNSTHNPVAKGIASFHELSSSILDNRSPPAIHNSIANGIESKLSGSIFARGLSSRDTSTASYGTESQLSGSIFNRSQATLHNSIAKGIESKLTGSLLSRGLSARDTSPATQRTESKLSGSIFARNLSAGDTSTATHGTEPKLSPSIFARGLSAGDTYAAANGTDDSRISQSIFTYGLSSPPSATSPATLGTSPRSQHRSPTDRGTAPAPSTSPYGVAAPSPPAASAVPTISQPDYRYDTASNRAPTTNVLVRPRSLWTGDFAVDS